MICMVIYDDNIPLKSGLEDTIMEISSWKIMNDVTDHR